MALPPSAGSADSEGVGTVGPSGRRRGLHRSLWDEGVFTPAVVFPTVPRGKARVRTIVTADHSEEDLTEALAAFEKAGRRLGLI